MEWKSQQFESSLHLNGTEELLNLMETFSTSGKLKLGAGVQEPALSSLQGKLHCSD